MIKEFTPLLLNSSFARIVNIGSISAMLPMPYGSAYSATKAALHAYGDVLRIELAPFNIRVITVVTGGVKSNISRPRQMPADSLYQPVEEIYQKRGIRMSQETPIPTDVYARSVVKEVLKSKPSVWFWTGYFAWMTWFMSTFLWKTVFDGPLSKRVGLDKLATIVKAKNAP
ncbi:hypothetical protein EW146_g4791 [Bondarzewia mesenterica]|uniref:Uncharacterized protein n=1 Tax=Bondarzewia mesenterica TaxID=1095465 RepID=A0A4S4LTZ3_9AGAM|nr:hypothetical protein EW146_g4791 [Bondarzewia mesenterica]